MLAWIWMPIFRMTHRTLTQHIQKWLPHLTALLTLVWLLGVLNAVNPVQDIIQRSGRIAITFLLASLACTPLKTVFKWRFALSWRKPLGLYAFGFASLHLLTFLIIDYGLNWNEIIALVSEKRFILLGSLSYLLLLPLAGTSFRYWMKRLGKNWKRLHRLVYLAGILTVLHFGLARKGDFFSLQGDILMPAIYALILLILLALRLPFFKTFSIAKWTSRK